jgi:hypothetical protein
LEAIAAQSVNGWYILVLFVRFQAVLLPAIEFFSKKVLNFRPLAIYKDVFILMPSIAQEIPSN